MDTEVQRIAALGAARRYCGWHIAPVRTDSMTLDGPGCPLLRLPTLRLLNIASLSEYGSPVDVSTLEWSPRGMVRKSDRTAWTDRLGGIEVVFEHGFDSAPEFDAVLTSAVGRGAFSEFGQVRAIGPFQFGGSSASVGVGPFSGEEASVLDAYALERGP